MIEARAKALSVVFTLEISLPRFMTRASEMVGGIPHINLPSLLLNTVTSIFKSHCS